MALPEIKIFDNLVNEKKTFVPIEPGKIKMYVCGVTVYDLTHVGHARVFIFFDVVQRFLREIGYEVKYVRNHTDVDDKIISRAAELGEDPLALSQRFIEELDADMGRLGVANADVEPKVSTHIPQIIAMVETLIEKGLAYDKNGDVYYRVRDFEGYGKLSGRKLSDMEAGRSGRVDEPTEKEYPFDFALWKSAKEGEISWDSPWGKGRPGWHIECSAMAGEHLGKTFDIHGGGRDLIFPHHENEIAQSEGAHDCGFSNYWMHVGMVNVAEMDEAGKKIERKMSKSLGNFWTTRDVLKGYHPDAIRLFMHTSHYSKPITYAEDNLEEATLRTAYFYETLSRIDETLERGKDVEEGDQLGEFADTISNFSTNFVNALSDDFNTPKAIAVLGEVAKIGNELTQSKKKPKPDQLRTMREVKKCMAQAGRSLGILERDPNAALLELRDLRVNILELDPKMIEAKIEDRKAARENKNWALGDAIRDELDALGVEIMDGSAGTTWRIKFG